MYQAACCLLYRIDQQGSSDDDEDVKGRAWVYDHYEGGRFE